ncbi:MAG: hypothetical protein KIT11_03125 [Fimbriimonadaceae bacterium]|nr:hypothetical protein [Fimbriimonadaceae bacterium]QYK57110.1 MAG: hypothetical protein KF733_06400 [Fimbriimonadaceae bacterium]
MADLPESLRELERVMAEAAEIALAAREELKVENKGDGSLVTNVDRAVETFLRERLVPMVPGTTVWGEEFGYEEPGENGSWLVDPIDGTSNFAYRQPLWGISAGLLQAGRLTRGAVILPDLGESYVAAEGQGAFLNGDRLLNVVPGPVKRTELMAHSEEVAPEFEVLGGKPRMLGAFVIEAMFAATGRIRGMTSHRCHLYDAAGSLVVCREVGLRVQHTDGREFDESGFARPVSCGHFAILPDGALQG